MGLLRLSLVIVLVWIGGLKFFSYEADSIVPLVSNSPVMSFFYHHPAPEYHKYMNREAELVPAHREWQGGNGTYRFSYGLGIVIVSIALLIALYPISPRASALGSFVLNLHGANDPLIFGDNPGSVATGSWRLCAWIPISLGSRTFSDQRRHHAWSSGRYARRFSKGNTAEGQVKQSCCSVCGSCLKIVMPAVTVVKSGEPSSVYLVERKAEKCMSMTTARFN